MSAVVTPAGSRPRKGRFPSWFGTGRGLRTSSGRISTILRTRLLSGPPRSSACRSPVLLIPRSDLGSDGEAELRDDLVALELLTGAVQLPSAEPASATRRTTFEATRRRACQPPCRAPAERACPRPEGGDTAFPARCSRRDRHDLELYREGHRAGSGSKESCSWRGAGCPRACRHGAREHPRGAESALRWHAAGADLGMNPG